MGRGARRTALVVVDVVLGVRSQLVVSAGRGARRRGVRRIAFVPGVASQLVVSVGRRARRTVFVVVGAASSVLA